MIIDKHEIISRLVKPEDLPAVMKAADEMAKLLFKPMGMYKSFYAIAHPQIEKDRPLRFFMLNTIDLNIDEDPLVCVVNPVIIKHTDATVDSVEGCATFNTLPTVTVQRWNKCQVEYSKIYFDKNKTPYLSPTKKKFNLSGKAARVFQHEINHLDAIYIY